jgi:hypothetical protein
VIDYDAGVRAAKDHVLKLLALMGANKPVSTDEVAVAFDSLNREWDRLTDALVRQRNERDRLIRSLLDQLAERKSL